MTLYIEFSMDSNEVRSSCNFENAKHFGIFNYIFLLRIFLLRNQMFPRRRFDDGFGLYSTMVSYYIRRWFRCRFVGSTQMNEFHEHNIVKQMMTFSHIILSLWTFHFLKCSNFCVVFHVWQQCPLTTIFNIHLCCRSTNITSMIKVQSN